MSTPPASPPVRDNRERQRFETEDEGQLSIAEYQLGAGTIAFTHTLVPPALRGRGIATRLVEAALASARAQRLGVVPRCSMFSVYMQRHPETHDLLTPAARRLLGL